MKLACASARPLRNEVAYEHVCEWSILGEAPPCHYGSSVPGNALSVHLNTTWAGERVNVDPTPPAFPGVPTSIEVLAQELMLFVGNPASDALAFRAAFDRQFRMWVRVDSRYRSALHEPVW